jgi:polysaccharide deacetylase 2 family uncharacterized protein YibQ
MPKRRSKRPVSPRAVGFLAVLAIVLFVAGEGWLFLRSDHGQLTVARWLSLQNDSRLVQLVGRHLRGALAVAGVPSASVREAAGPRLATETGDRAGGGEAGFPTVRSHWRAELAPDASLLQTNYAITSALAGAGIDVLDGHERYGPDGQPQLVLVIGAGGRATHEVVLARAAREPGSAAVADTSARLALVMFGFGDDLAAAQPFLALPLPFAVALAPGGKQSAALFRDAHRASREVVLHLPLEPINYPQVNPGPGTILVSMRPTQIATLVRRDLEQAAPVAAVANHLGSLATQDMTVMTSVYRELHRERVPFLHVEPAAGAVCKSLASELGVAYDEPDAVIDYEARSPKNTLLDKRWKELLALARTRGHLMVMVRATPRTLAWLPQATAVKRLKGVSLVPLSSLLRRPPI